MYRKLFGVFQTTTKVFLLLDFTKTEADFFLFGFNQQILDKFYICGP